MSTALNSIIAKNISDIRLGADISADELAQMLSVTREDVLLWESGELIPDVLTLKKLADRFGVSVDYFLTRTHRGYRPCTDIDSIRGRTHLTVTLLAFFSVWIMAAIAFAVTLIFPIPEIPAFMSFVYAAPVSCITLIVFNSIWGDVRFNIIFSSIALWGLCMSAYFTLLFALGTPMWMLFVIAAALQIALCFIPGTGLVNYSFFKIRR